MTQFEEIDLFFAENLLKDRATPGSRLLIATLLWAARQGHLCLPLAREGQLELLASFEDRELLVDHLQQGVEELPMDLCEKTRSYPDLCKPLCLWEGALYLQKNWLFETRFIEHLEKRLTVFSLHALPSDDANLTSEQRIAINRAEQLPLSIICGGPGTGKTYTAVSIVRAFFKKDPHAIVRLAAPTGKAAKQLKTYLERHQLMERVMVSTLHSLMEIHDRTDFFYPPGKIYADLLIIDECSMIDARLFSSLLAATPLDTHLVLMGDPYQLPPIETGSLFTDLVKVVEEIAPHHLSRFNQCLRSEVHEILNFAEQVKMGKMEEVWQTCMHGSEELEFIPLDFHSNAVDEMLWQMTHHLFPTTIRDPLSHFCLLSCLRKGAFGVDRLNQLFSRRFLSLMKPGDLLPMPIILTRSDAELELSNGDTGVLIHHFSGEGDYALFGSKMLPFNLLPPYEYAYALSVHKSQGSEYDEVLLLVPPGAEHFGREIIYTGATRAKKRLKICSNREILEKALARHSGKISSLHARLKKIR